MPGQNANLVSSKQLTSFSDFRLPLDHPDHLTLEVCQISHSRYHQLLTHVAQEYVDYLSAYATAFRIQDRIQFRCRVTHITKDPSGGHTVTYVRKPVDSEEWLPGKLGSLINVA
jgi:dimethylaniline monooxygenase (N-oxide forming)